MITHHHLPFASDHGLAQFPAASASRRSHPAVPASTCKEAFKITEEKETDGRPQETRGHSCWLPGLSPPPPVSNSP